MQWKSLDQLGGAEDVQSNELPRIDEHGYGKASFGSEMSGSAVRCHWQGMALNRIGEAENGAEKRRYGAEKQGFAWDENRVEPRRKEVNRTDSIIQTGKECWFCGSRYGLESHHIFAGVANRRISEKYGLKVWLCKDHHTGKDGAQYDKEKNLQLKQEAQRKFESIYDHDMWMHLIRKNYL